MKESLVPNLDCIPIEDLIKFRARHMDGQNFKDLNVSHHTAFWLAEYAREKVRAMQCRLNGQVSVAMNHEAGCEMIYLTMIPKRHRW